MTDCAPPGFPNGWFSCPNCDALSAEAEMMNERAEQAGAEWTMAKFAWRRRGDLVRSAFFADDFAILDQFFGGGEGEG
jgi:hypothetical protein